MDSGLRGALLQRLDELSEIEDTAPPVVPIADYFEGNRHEESIAPNQWLDGNRASISQIYATLLTIERRPDVQRVLVGLHFDWVEAFEDHTVWPAAENIHIYSSASIGEVERWVSRLSIDGVAAGWPYGRHAAAPPVEPGSTVYTVFWD